MFRPRGTGTKDPTHAKGSPEWLEFNKEKLDRAASTLNRLLGEAGLGPAAQERLRTTFRFATDDRVMKTAVRIERDAQQKDDLAQ
jgi:hypothetical protein